MGFFSFLKYTIVIFVAHLATSCGTPVRRGAPFENHCTKQIKVRRGTETRAWVATAAARPRTRAA
jgi:hypothetical protein